MNQQVLLIRVPAPVREPRGAVLTGQVVVLGHAVWRGLARLGGVVWRALAAEGERRAAREMRAHGMSQKTLEAAQVRALADRHQRSDPGFAADLRSAADRHELEAEMNAELLSRPT
jgi:hypothetical protein